MKCQTKLTLRKIVLPTFFALAASANVAAFSDTSTDLMKQEEEDSYNKHQYQQAADAGFRLTSLHLADALVRLNRIDDALREYTACSAIATDAKIKSYCDKAIADLTPLSQPHQSEKNAAVMAEERQTILGRGTEEITFKRRLADQQIAKLEREANEKIASVPTFITDSCGNRVPNPDYDDIVNHIRMRTTEKIEAANAQFEKDRADIANNYHKQAQAVETNQP
jgi:hypothetical protein